MRKPSVMVASEGLAKNMIDTMTEYRSPGGKHVWVPSRPEPNFTSRWKAAWLVLTGKADALTWIGQ